MLLMTITKKIEYEIIYIENFQYKFIVIMRKKMNMFRKKS
uniref:Uncharacterized protein n=1 Tax=Promethearchaeum syntrophicum TaxID=2594042 RepID=A0A5B9DA01_9ARCH|nr:hypothetical protein DSAG12_01494 [Candidatus Prometheoarchaeum syntrophicum]